MSLVEVKNVQKEVFEVILNRPEKRNALSIALMEELCGAFETLESDPDCRVIVLRGQGSVFCAGLDLKEAGEKDKTERSSQMVAKTLKSVYASSKVTIAAVQGAAIAGGAGVMASCDFILADENTKFGFPEVQRGLVAAQVLALLLRQLNVRDVRELLLFGNLIDAKKAHSIGLINEVCKQGSLLSEAYAMGELALHGAPKAQALTKKLIDQLSAKTFEQTLDIALKSHFEMRQSDEAKEGTLAFLEKRNPNWMVTE